MATDHYEKYGRVYYENNRDKIKARSARRYEENKDKILARNKAWYLANKEKYKATVKAWRAKNPEKCRLMRIKAMYRIEPSEYMAMVKAQGGLCAVCRHRKLEGWGRRELCLDHDHKTGKVRGLLCNPCNVALGHLRDDLEIARALVAYLEKHDAAGGLQHVDRGHPVGGNNSAAPL